MRKFFKTTVGTSDAAVLAVLTALASPAAARSALRMLRLKTPILPVDELLGALARLPALHELYLEYESLSRTAVRHEIQSQIVRTAPRLHVLGLTKLQPSNDARAPIRNARYQTQGDSAPVLVCPLGSREPPNTKDIAIYSGQPGDLFTRNELRLFIENGLFTAPTFPLFWLEYPSALHLSQDWVGLGGRHWATAGLLLNNVAPSALVAHGSAEALARAAGRLRYFFDRDYIAAANNNPWRLATTSADLVDDFIGLAQELPAVYAHLSKFLTDHSVRSSMYANCFMRSETKLGFIALLLAHAKCVFEQVLNPKCTRALLFEELPTEW